MSQTSSTYLIYDCIKSQIWRNYIYSIIGLKANGSLKDYIVQTTLHSITLCLKMVQLPSIKLLIENILIHYCHIKRPAIGSLKHLIVQTTLHSITLCLKLILPTLY